MALWAGNPAQCHLLFPQPNNWKKLWGGPSGLRRASTPACSVARRAGPGGPGPEGTPTGSSISRHWERHAGWQPAGRLSIGPICADSIGALDTILPHRGKQCGLTGPLLPHQNDRRLLHVPNALEELADGLVLGNRNGGGANLQCAREKQFAILDLAGRHVLAERRFERLGIGQFVHLETQRQLNADFFVEGGRVQQHWIASLRLREKHRLAPAHNGWLEDH